MAMVRMPWGVKLALRLIGFGLVAVVLILPLYRAGVAFRTVEFAEQCTDEAQYNGVKQTSLVYAKRFSLCMFLKNGFVEAARMEPALLHVMALPTLSCARVGIWKSTRRRSVYTVTLRDDSRFTAEPVVAASAYAESASGYWGEHQGVMVWIYENGVIWPPDINRIESDGPGRFTLIEVNGERTEFIQQQRLESKLCPA